MADPQVKLIKTLEYNRQLWTARYSPCGNYLFAAGYDALIQRWDVTSDEPRSLPPLAGHQGWVQKLALAGDLLLTADSWGRLMAWRYVAEDPTPVWNIEQALAGWIRDLAVSPDQTTVAVAGNDARVRQFSVSDGKLLGETGPHAATVFSVAFHPDGRSLITGDWKGTLRHWNVATGQLTRQIELPAMYRLDRIQDCGGVRHLAFDGTGQRLLCGGMQNPGGGFAEGAPLLLVLDWEKGTVTHELQCEDKTHGFIYDAAFHPGGYVMATTCAMPNTGHLWFWRLGEPKPFYLSTDLPNGRSLSLHPNGTRLALVTAVAQNANGRPKGMSYVDGTAKIQLLQIV